MECGPRQEINSYAGLMKTSKFALVKFCFALVLFFFPCGRFSKTIHLYILIKTQWGIGCLSVMYIGLHVFIKLNHAA